MRVAVDQAGQAGRVAEFDNLRTRHVDAADFDILDAFALDDDRGLAEQFAGGGVDEVAAVNCDDLRWRRRFPRQRGGRQDTGAQRKKECLRPLFHGRLPAE